MSAVTRSPLSSSSPDSESIMQLEAATELERNPSVSYIIYSWPLFVDGRQIRDSVSGLIANAQNRLISGGTFVPYYCH